MNATQDLSITTMHYKPVPSKPDYQTFDHYATYHEVIEQVRSVLKNIKVPEEEYDAYDAAEWFNINRELNVNEECKGGLIGPFTREGNCEGYTIDIMHFNPNDVENTYITLCTIKFLSGKDDVWYFSKLISEAIYNG